uniref:hypothetical protein n=1 Tax=Streptomyces sp. NBC_01001 TaxID=2903713 RepID=UPI002F908E8F|nr:hypothetical protein OG296_40840 [Streptomyces sp. NBC_01001]
MPTTAGPDPPFTGVASSRSSAFGSTPEPWKAGVSMVVMLSMSLPPVSLDDSRSGASPGVAGGVVVRHRVPEDGRAAGRPAAAVLPAPPAAR